MDRADDIVINVILLKLLFCDDYKSCAELINRMVA